MSEQLMLSAEDFPVRTSPTRDWERVWTVPGPAFGPTTGALLASFDQPSSSWKTSQHFLDEGLTEFSGTWPRSGMMRSGIAYQLPPLVPLTDATGSGLWPTPTVVYTREDWEPERIKARQAEVKAATTANGKHHTGNGFGLNLSQAVRMAAVLRFPTPTRSMHKGSSAGAMTRLSGASRLNDRLDYAVEQGHIKTGRLNPLWVAWLMGFPIEWASFAPTATPSSPKSPS